MEVSAGTSGGGCWVEDMSRWTDTPHPGKLGGEKRAQQRKVERRKTVTDEGLVGVRSRGGNEYPEHG